MKVVILAGGLGTRLAEETQVRPKPMVEIGGLPIIWHIMTMYARHGLTDFIICLGYKGYMIKEYFSNLFLHNSDVRIDISTGRVDFLGSRNKHPWTVTLVDTGMHTMTGGRLRNVRQYLVEGETFCMTYGDGVTDLNLTELISFHKRSGLEATLTAVQPPSRYGVTVVNEDRVICFTEKPHGEGGRINGGFFVLEPRVIDRIDGDSTTWEAEPLENLAAEGQLAAYRHDGFWHAMDTLRDKNYLEALWQQGKAPWMTW